MRGVVVLVAGQGPQQVQLDLLGSGGQGRAWDRMEHGNVFQDRMILS